MIGLLPKLLGALLMPLGFVLIQDKCRSFRLRICYSQYLFKNSQIKSICEQLREEPSLNGSQPSARNRDSDFPWNLNQKCSKEWQESLHPVTRPGLSVERRWYCSLFFLSLKREILGIELVCWSGSRLECVSRPQPLLPAKPWIDRGCDLSVLYLSDGEEANKPKCFICTLWAPYTCQSLLPHASFIQSACWNQIQVQLKFELATFRERPHSRTFFFLSFTSVSSCDYFSPHM